MAEAKILVTADNGQAVGVFNNTADAMRATLGAGAGEASANAKASFRDLWDNFTAQSHNAISDMGEGFKALGGTVADGLGDPLGTAKELLHGVLDSMGPFGVGLSAIALAGYEVGKSLFELGEKATETGAQVAKLALILNESATNASALKFGYESVGGSVEGLTKLVFMFEQRMETSSAKVTAGLKDIGLSLKDIDGLDTPDQIAKISEAARNAGENVNIAAAMFQIFGKSAKTEITELLGPLSEGIAKSRELGAVWGDEDAKAALAFTREIAAMKTQTEATWTTIGKDFAPISEAFVAGWDRMKLAVANVAYDVERLVTGFGYLSAAWHQFVTKTEEETPKVQKSLKGIVDAQGDVIGLAAKGLDDYMKHAAGAADLDADMKAKMAGAARELKVELEEQTKATNAALEAQKKYDDVWGEIAQMGADWVGTLAQMTDKTRGLAKDLLDQGLAEEKVAIATGATIEQVKALTELKKYMVQQDKLYADLDKELSREKIEQIKLVAEENKKSDDARKRMMQEQDRDTLKSITDTNVLYRQHYDYVTQRAMTAEQQQKAAVRSWFDDEVSKLKADDLNWQAHYDALVVAAQDKMQKVTEAHDLTFQAIRKMQDDLSTGWQKNFSDTLLNTGSFGKAFESIWDTVKKDVENIFSSMLSSIISGFLQPLLDNVKSVASSVSSMLMNALTGGKGGTSDLLGTGISWALGGASTAATSGLAATMAGISASEAAGAAGAAAAGMGVGFGGSAAGATGASAGGAAAGGGGIMGGLGSVATFLATNPIGWAIDAGIAALLLWNHFSGPDKNEVAGREVKAQWASDIWSKGLTSAQKAEASGAGWANPQDAGTLIFFRDQYASLGRPNPEQSAENYINSVWGAIPKGYNAMHAAIANVGAFKDGGIAGGDGNVDSTNIRVTRGEGIFTENQMAKLAPVHGLADKLDALHATMLDMTAQMRDNARRLPIDLRHAMRGARA